MALLIFLGDTECSECFQISNTEDADKCNILNKDVFTLEATTNDVVNIFM